VAGAVGEGVARRKRLDCRLDLAGVQRLGDQFTPRALVPKGERLAVALATA